MKPFYIICICFLLLCCNQIEPETNPCEDLIPGDYPDIKDFGIGVLDEIYYYYHYSPDVVLNIYSHPDTLSLIITEYHFNERMLVFSENDSCKISSSTKIEWDYEISGFAILSINTDSTFVQVTLNPWLQDNPINGWIKLNPPKIKYKLWSDFLPEKSNLFFLNQYPIKFYSDSNLLDEIAIELESFNNSDRFNYGLKPIEVNGTSLKVEVYSPSIYCEPQLIVEPDTAWVKYLTDDLRPRLYFFSRGC